MYIFGEYAANLGLTAVTLGAALVVLPLLDRNNTLARTAVMALVILLAWRYVGWRFTATIPPLALDAGAVAAWAFACLEALAIASSTLSCLILTRTRNRSSEADANAEWWKPSSAPRVDVYIPTYNEELPVLYRTIVGAKELSYPCFRVFILDDRSRLWLADHCEQLGVDYRTRPNNQHAKAGNINHTYLSRVQDADAPDFIVILDADFVPHRDFISRTLALFHDPLVGIVQTPQHFFNPDPIQHNLGISQFFPDEQRFFFDHIEPSRDAWGIAFCCGTSSMIRSKALAAAGGLPTDSVTEDYLLTLRFEELGWHSVYLNEPLSEGLAPEGMQEYIAQRARWCLGMMQIVRNSHNPFRRNRMTPMLRIGVIDSLLYWTSTFWFRFAGLVCPLLYWYFGLTVVDARVSDVIGYYLPFSIAIWAGLNWLSPGLIFPLLKDVSQLLPALAVMRATIMGLTSDGPHRFHVTAKGGDRSKVVVQWQLMRPFIVFLVLTIGGLLLAFVDPRFSYDQVAGDGMTVILFWTIYNLLLIALTILSCVELPRTDRPLRSLAEPVELRFAGSPIGGWLSELGLETALVRGPRHLALAEAGTLEIDGIAPMIATVSAELHNGYLLSLAPTAEQRQLLVTRLHTQSGAPGVLRGSLSGMFRQLASSLNFR